MISNYPCKEVKEFGERVSAALLNTNIKDSTCKKNDFDEDLRPYIEEYLNNGDSIAIVYTAMRTRELSITGQQTVPVEPSFNMLEMGSIASNYYFSQNTIKIIWQQMLMASEFDLNENNERFERFKRFKKNP